MAAPGSYYYRAVAIQPVGRGTTIYSSFGSNVYLYCFRRIIFKKNIYLQHDGSFGFYPALHQSLLDLGRRLSIILFGRTQYYNFHAAHL